MTETPSQPYKIFISHAGEDKATMAIPLRTMLLQHGIKAFVDEMDMPPGVKATKSMLNAMKTADVGVMVLSPEFVARKWPMKELLCFQRRCEKANSDGRPPPVIIPVFYRLNIEDLYDEPRLDRVDAKGKGLYHSSRFFERMNSGEPEANIAIIRAAMRDLHDTMGVRNDVGASNGSENVMRIRREILLERICLLIRENYMPRADGMVSKTPGGSLKSASFRPYYHRFHDTSKLVVDFCRTHGQGNADTPERKLLQLIDDNAVRKYNSIAVYGIGGVGKTSLLRGLSCLEQLKQRFKGGIYLLSLGMDAIKQTLRSGLSTMVEDSGGEKQGQMMREQNEFQKQFRLFGSWFAGKSCLFMIDDVWERDEISPSIIQDLLSLHQFGVGSKVLITTRSSEIASQADEHFRLDAKHATASICRAILVRYAGTEPEVGDIRGDAALGKILEKCDGLPLFLSLAGKAVKALSMATRGERSAGYHVYARSIESSMQGLLHKTLDSYHQRLSASLSISVHQLEERMKLLGFPIRLTASAMHRRLCVMKKHSRAPMSMLVHLWEVQKADHAAIVAREFAQLGLADVEIEKVGREYVEFLRIHDSLHEFAACETRKHNEESLCHERVLHGYSAQLTREEDGAYAWWSHCLENDGYIHRNLYHHLIGAGREKEAKSLLLRPEWTERTCEVFGLLEFEELNASFRAMCNINRSMHYNAMNKISHIR